MDQLLVQLGVAGGLVLSVSALVNPAINHFRGAFNFDGKVCVVLAYTLSMVLMFLLTLALDQTFFQAPIYATLAKTAIAGWAAGIYAGNLADTHNRAVEKVAEKRAEKAFVDNVLPPPV